jgi:hypothetical protein
MLFPNIHCDSLQALLWLYIPIVNLHSRQNYLCCESYILHAINSNQFKHNQPAAVFVLAVQLFDEAGTNNMHQIASPKTISTQLETIFYILSCLL